MRKYTRLEIKLLTQKHTHTRKNQTRALQNIENIIFNILTPGVISHRCHKSHMKHLNSKYLMRTNIAKHAVPYRCGL